MSPLAVYEPSRLAANESPDAPLPEVRRAITAASALAHRYPDDTCSELTGEISLRMGVPRGDVVIGPGSIGVLQALVATTCTPGTDCVFATPSFDEYRALVTLVGATPVAVPLRAGVHDLPAMAAAITDRTRLVIVCNPNNPTGTIVESGDFARFLDVVPERCVIVLDEAYRDYVVDTATPDGLRLYRSRPGVAVLRTFSKAHGLAGLRVGFLVGDATVSAAVRRAQVPYAVNSLAQAAAVASLRSSGEVSMRVQRVAAERTRVREALVADGWPAPPTHGNFVWLPLGAATAEFAATCLEAGIAIRCFPGLGARVSIGAPDENDRFLEVAHRHRTPGALLP